MKDQPLSAEQAFDAMVLFLNRYYERSRGNAQMAALLADIQKNQKDGRPFDPAAWTDWLAAIDAVCASSVRREEIA